MLHGNQVAKPHVGQLMDVAAAFAVIYADIIGRHAGAGLMLHAGAAGVSGRIILLGQEWILAESLGKKLYDADRSGQAGGIIGVVLRIDVMGHGHGRNIIKGGIGAGDKAVIGGANGDQIGGQVIGFGPIESLSAVAVVDRPAQGAIGDDGVGGWAGHMQSDSGLVFGDVLAGPPDAGLIGFAEGVNRRSAAVGGSVIARPKSAAGGGGAVIEDTHREGIAGRDGGRQGDVKAVIGAIVSVGQG